MKKRVFFSLLITLLLFSLALGTFGEESNVSENSTSSVVSTSSLAHYVKPVKVGVLPGNPFYFWKQLRERVKVFFVADPVKKAEIELRYLDRRLAEVEKVSRLRPQILQKAFRNYETAIERLRKRLENLKQTSSNPEIDKLLDLLTEIEIRHQNVLEKLLQSSSTSTRPFVKKARSRLLQVMPLIHLQLENPQAFSQRLKQKLEAIEPAAPDKPARELRKLKLMKTIEKTLKEENLSSFSTSTREKVQKLQQNLQQRIRQQIRSLKKQGIASSTIDKILEARPVTPLNQKRFPPVFKRLPQHSPRLHHLPPKLK